MAKIKLSMVVSDMRGKLNGSVFARNRGGLYVRTKVTPSNPQTGAQQLARNILGSLSQQWKTLTDSQRLSWNNAVGNFQTTDVFGDIRNPSGLNLFVRLNANLGNVGVAPILVAPQPQGAKTVEVFNIVPDGTGQAFDLDNGLIAVPANTSAVIESTVGVSAGKSNVNSLYRKINVVVAAGAITADMISEQTIKFGAVVTGQRYSVRIKYVNITTGEVSVPITASAIAI